MAFNVGLRAAAYRIQQHTFTDVESRASVKFAVGEDYSIKASYARMHQYVQQISNNYINLPTDLWQPVTASFKPIRSNQYSLGVYGNLPLAMYFSVEGWYKTMSNLLEYRDGVSVLNPRLYWEDKLTMGKGWSYGVDIAVTKEVGQITGTVGYGLLWNWRKFDELNQGQKFPAKAVTVSTTYQGKAVTATDVMPQPVAIEDISVARQGPMSVYTDTDFIFTYGITFSDRTNESNYYFLQWDEVEPSKDVRMGERDFTYEFVFQQLANEVHATLPGWTPYCAYGLPFSDKGIEGERHTITVKEIVQMAVSADWQKTQMKRKFKLYSISKAYYDYLFSVLINQTNDKGIQGGLIDLGLVNPVKAYTNIDGGIGIMGCYTTAERVLDVMEIVGPFLTGK